MSSEASFWGADSASSPSSSSSSAAAAAAAAAAAGSGSASSTSSTENIGAGFEVPILLPRVNKDGEEEPTKKDSEAGDIPVWTIVELQGSLVDLTGSNLPVQAGPNATLDVGGKRLGRMCIEQRRGKDVPVLYIGSHILDGRIETLPKPLLITRRRRSGVDHTDYVVLGVARQKVLFKNRPRFNLKPR